MPKRSLEPSDMHSLQKQLRRVRRICLSLPETTEKLSHGEPHFIVGKRRFVTFDDHHRGDGQLAIWLPVPSGAQPGMIERNPEIFFKPPYVGVRGWVGINLRAIRDDDLRFHIEVAWELVAPKRLLLRR